MGCDEWLNGKVELNLPKPVIDFIKESWNTDNIQVTLTKELVETCFAQLDADANDQLILPEALIKKYGLLPVFKQFGLLPQFIDEIEEHERSYTHLKHCLSCLGATVTSF